MLILIKATQLLKSVSGNKGHDIIIHDRFLIRSFSTKTSAFPEKVRTYYEDLEIPTTATKEDVRRAFLRLAKRYHPDTASGAVIGSEYFQRIQIAYAVLSDEAKRREYDWRSRGIWRHSPSGMDPFAKSAEFQRQRREFWRQWEERKGSEQDLDGKGCKYRYTEAELAEMEAAAKVRRLEYQQQMIEKFREIGKRKEAIREKSYREAQQRYSSSLDYQSEDDDLGRPPTGWPYQCYRLVKRYLTSWLRQRIVSGVATV